MIKNLSNFRKSKKPVQGFEGFVEGRDIAKKSPIERALNLYDRSINKIFHFTSSGFGRLIVKLPYKYRSRIFNLQKHLTKYQILNTVYRRRLAGAFMIAIIISSTFLNVFEQVKPPPKLQLTDLPYQEKVADGVWKLKNRDPIHQVLASAKKADLILKENKQISKDPNKQMFKWSVTNANGTKFEFGGVNSETPKDKVLPIVKITNSQGYFVSYSPRMISTDGKQINTDPCKSSDNQCQSLPHVTPEVKGNVISWKLPSGVVARYTMMQDRVKADYIVDSKDSLCHQDDSCSNPRLEFDVTSGRDQISTDSKHLPAGKAGINTDEDQCKSAGDQCKSLLKGELMPGGDIDWFSGEDGQANNHFIFPAPIVKDSNQASDTVSAAYEFSKVKAGEYELTIVLDPNQLKSATWPLTIDPVVIDTINYWDEVLADNPTVLLKMDEASGSLVDTQVGNNAAVSGTAMTYGVTGPTTGITKAVRFAAGTLATITDGTDVDLGDGPLSIELWIKRAAAGNSYQPVIKANDVATAGYQLYWSGDFFRLTDGARTSNIHSSAYGTDTDLGWHHWVFTRGSGVYGKVWRDGVDVTTQSNVLTFSDNNLNLILGNDWAGDMAGFAVYKSELSAARVAAHYVASSASTAYGNGRKILRDPWGNLIAFMDGGTGNDNVWYKNYNSTTWADANIDLDSGAGSAVEIAADLDSTGSAHLAFRNTTANAIQYMPLKITRDGNNAISSIGTQAAFSLDTTVTTGASKRPSLIIANKGGGAGVEKIAVVYAMNATSGTIRGEFRFMQCDVADACNAAANWKSASEELNGSGTCADTGTGNVGMPTTTTCKGTADRGIINLAAFTSHQAVLTQVPGKPKRSPASVKKDINGTFTDLTNTIDNNTGTTDAVNSLTTTDYIYVGDDKPFSKATFDITNTNTNAQLFTTMQYWNGASWVALANARDNTATTTVAFSEDGSIMFDEPSDWATTSVNSVSKYWIRLRPAGAFDATVSIAEVYVNDRNSKALIIIAGDDNTDDMGVNYAVWDEVTNSAWENKSTTAAGTTWTQASQAIDVNGANWGTWTNFPLTMTVDYKNNITYLAYISGLTVGSSDIVIKSIPNNKDPIVAASWTSVGFPTTTEAAGTVVSLTSDGSDIYLFYVLNPGTNSLVFRKCTPSGGGNGNICDTAADWGSEKTLDNTTDVSHPQAIVTKVTGDTVAIDTVYTKPTALTVVYERHYVDLTDKTVTVAVSGDDAFQRDCISGTDDQDITATTVKLGRETADASCVGSVDSEDHIGLRFPAITVIQGAAISSAYVDLRVTTRTGATPVDFTTYGEDADNSAAFTAFTDCADPCANGVNTRTKTTSSTTQSVNFVTNTYRIDVTDLVQEIVCRGAVNSQPCVGDFNGSGTWASGNALSLLMVSAEGGASDNNILAVSQDDATATMLDPTIQINLGSTGKNYSLGSATQLATGSASFADFDHPLSSVEMGAVATDDTNFASVSATTNYASQSAQPAFMFKVNNSNNSNAYKIDASAIVKSTLATSDKPVYLQVYRGGSTNDWVTRASNNNTAGDTDISLTAQTVDTNTSEYYFNETPGIGTRYAECTTSTANCWTYWRVYQDNPTTTFNNVLSVDYVNVSFSSPPGPDKVAFSNAARTLTAAVCNGAASVFTMELQQGTTPTNPTSTTVVRVTSNSSSYTIYSDDTCATPVTNGDFTYTTSQNTKSVYIKDLSSGGGKTLTGTRQSGDVLTTGTQDYTLNNAPAAVIRGGTIIRGGSKIQ